MKGDSRAIPLSRWAKAVVRRRIAILEREIARLGRQPDEDAIHDVRVASRRLRAALRHLEPCFAEDAVEHATSALRTLARLLGEARDIDIILANLAETAPPSNARLQRTLQRRRAARLQRTLPAAAQLARRLPSLERELNA